MKIIYKGFEIEVKRVLTLAGWEEIIYSAYRLSDGWCLDESYASGDEKISEYVDYMKEKVDELLKYGYDQDQIEEFLSEGLYQDQVSDRSD